MRRPDPTYGSHPWVIADVVPDFTLLDVWALPVEGDAPDFDSFLEAMASIDPTRTPSLPTRALFRLRFCVGSLMGWDDPGKKRPIPGCTETTLTARLPGALRPTSNRTSGPAGRFTPLYRTEDEWAAEISNDTVHGVLHLAWVRQADRRYHAYMAVYVKARGRLGELYLKLIQPFRRLIVYPALVRAIGRAWERRSLYGLS